MKKIMLTAIKDSPISSFKFHDRLFYVKRDDLLNPIFNGNKARKLAFYLDNDLPYIDTLISYGGDQSNLMYSLSALAKLKKWHFKYYTRRVSQQALNQQSGNLLASLNNNMELIQIEKNFKTFCQNMSMTRHRNELLIAQGGYGSATKYGIQTLAHEIRCWAQSSKFMSLSIFIASGTGTTAFYLQQQLPEFKVYTTNCVGNYKYLLQQFSNLPGADKGLLPIILNNPKFRFAVPHPELWEIIQQINLASGILFDLVYDPVGWHVLLNHLPLFKEPVLYLHCGGTQGNPTMLGRYNYHTIGGNVSSSF